MYMHICDSKTERNIDELLQHLPVGPAIYGFGVVDDGHHAP